MTQIINDSKYKVEAGENHAVIRICNADSTDGGAYRLQLESSLRMNSSIFNLSINEKKGTTILSRCPTNEGSSEKVLQIINRPSVESKSSSLTDYQSGTISSEDESQNMDDKISKKKVIRTNQNMHLPSITVQLPSTELHLQSHHLYLPSVCVHLPPVEVKLSAPSQHPHYKSPPSPNHSPTDDVKANRQQ